MFWYRKKPKNAAVQYEPRFLPEEKKVEAEEAPSLREFIQKVTPRYVHALDLCGAELDEFKSMTYNTV
jgi:hypothetical protein